MYSLTPFEKDFFSMNPFGEFFKDRTGMEMCRTDIRDEGNSYVMESELPGFEKDDINIDISGGCLTLSAQRSSENEEKDSGGKYIRRERSYGSYRRSFDLSGIDEDNISADYKNGILTLTLPKKQAQVPASRRLTIN